MRGGGAGSRNKEHHRRSESPPHPSSVSAGGLLAGDAQTTSIRRPENPPCCVSRCVPSSVVVPPNQVVLDDADHTIPARADWIGQAACAGVDSTLFFPAKGENIDAAMALCAGCPVKLECLAFALEHDCQGI